MSEVCAIASCEQIPRVLCYCCKRNLCLEHLFNHRTHHSNPSNTLSDQVKLLEEEFRRLNIDRLSENNRQKLDKWRYDSLKKIDRYYEKKCEEFDRFCHDKFHEQQKEIDQLFKKVIDLNIQEEYTNDQNQINELQRSIEYIQEKINLINEKGIPMNIRPLLIDHYLITIGESKCQEFDLTILPSPYQTINCSNQLGSVLACNDRFLLINQSSSLSLFNTDLSIVRQCLWKYGIIYDMCWSEKLNSFIVITEKSKAFLINGITLFIENIQSMLNQLWMSCTSSHSSLYLTSSTNAIVEFSLSTLKDFTRRWDPPITCKNNELIKDIACNDDTLALIIVPFYSNKIIHFILRSLITFDQLHSIRLDIRHPSYQLPIRCSSFKNDEWLIADANTSYCFHVYRDGKVKGAFRYNQSPYHIVSFGLNIIVIRTENTLNFHQLLDS